MIFKILRNISSIIFKIIPRNNNLIIILKPDNIGDYILFRSFLSSIASSRLYSGKKFLFIGNEAFRSIYDNFDVGFFDFQIWTSPNKLKKRNSLTYFKLLIRVILKRPNNAILCLHSSSMKIEKFLNDLSLKYIYAPVDDGINDSRVPNFRLNKLNYNQIASLSVLNFEYYRNKQFIENLLNEQLSNSNFELKSPKENRRNTIIIVIGANEQSKLWDINNFIWVVNEIESQYPGKYQFIFTGTTKEYEIYACRAVNLDEKANVKLLFGSQSLTELIDIMSLSRLVISNETGTIHLAAACETSFVCIANGAKFLRFSPYPEELLKSESVTIFPDLSFYEPKSQNQLALDCCIQSDYQINNISPEAVFSQVVRILECN